MSFARLRESTLACLAPLPYSALPLAPSYTRARRAEKSGELVLESRFFDVAGRAELRIVTISSAKIDIVTMFLFPVPEYQLPVFAMEFVVLGGKPIVGVIDACCLLPAMHCATPVQGTLARAHASWPDLRQADDPPQWYLECRSGNDFFVRPQNLAEIARLGDAHLSIWRSIVQLASDPARFSPTEAESHRSRIQDYKDHHRVNSPGLKLMNRSFGKGWTDDYMSGVLFA